VLAEIRRIIAPGGMLVLADLARHEREWVRERPGRLTDGAAKRVYVQTSKLERLPSSSISRADVADFLVGACERSDVVGQAVQLGG
jgi:ubiquinone/menaquinone biosynthesis C-methylase UbiE